MVKCLDWRCLGGRVFVDIVMTGRRHRGAVVFTVVTNHGDSVVEGLLLLADMNTPF